MKILITFLFLYTPPLFSKIKEVKIIDPQERSFDFSRVCHFKGISSAPLIEVKNSITLDCMGVSVKINEFCQERSGGRLIKSYIDQENEKVVCQNGNGAKLKITCEKNHVSCCQSKVIGCKRIHRIIAKDIPLVHSSITKENGVKTLNCYFLYGQGADYF